VAKKALLEGLEESQTRTYGLPIRPSFARAVLVKVLSIFKVQVSSVLISLMEQWKCGTEFVFIVG